MTLMRRTSYTGMVLTRRWKGGLCTHSYLHAPAIHSYLSTSFPPRRSFQKRHCAPMRYDGQIDIVLQHGTNAPSGRLRPLRWSWRSGTRRASGFRASTTMIRRTNELAETPIGNDCAGKQCPDSTRPAEPAEEGAAIPDILNRLPENLSDM
jgi:hypothetical protein